jgi:hypothetical protein
MKKILGSMLIIVGLIFLYKININSQISVAKMQNNLNLEFVNDCVKHYIGDKKPTSNDLINGLNLCAKGLLSNGITGDIFVIRQSDRKLFWDNSTDCKPDSESKMYMTSKGVCSLFKNEDTCIIAVDMMVTNEPRGYTTWMFDDSLEYINYKYLYTEINGDKYIIGQGTQSDELESNFIPFYIASGIWGFMLILFINV